jgi:hypothetical protein
MTSTSTFVLRTAIGAALCAVSLPASAGPSMTTSLQSTTLELAECLQRGETSLREAGMTRNLQVMQLTVYGEQGEYTGSVRCVPGYKVVFFVVAGPRPDRASKYMADLREKF